MKTRYPFFITCCFILTSCSAVAEASSANSTADSYYLVLGSYSNLATAEEALASLQLRVAEPLQIGLAETAAALLYRVLAGPVGQQMLLDDLRNKAVAAGIEGSWKIPLGEMVLLADDILETEQFRPTAVSSAPQSGAGETVKRDASSLQSEEVEIALEEITLVDVVQMALAQNLELRASEQALVAGEAEVRKAKSSLLPNIEVGVLQTALDQDRADASFGQAPQYRTSARVRFSQLIYSDAARAAHQISEILQQAKSDDQRSRILDTILAASSAYLSLLRAESLVRIFGDDLKLTDSNFERAQIRLELGVANKAEVYRWQTRQASARKALVLAQATVKKARINLNLVINKPLDSRFRTRKPTLQDSYFLITRDGNLDRIQRPENMMVLRDYWLSEAVVHVPRLQALHNQRKALARALLAANRSLRIPTVALSLDAVKHLSEGGAGTEQLDFTFPGFETRIGGTFDELEWTAVVTATLPLYSGGERYAEVRQKRAELSRIDLLLDEALRKIEASVLINMAAFEASLTNISFARDAATASKNNLELVTDSYARGIVTIIDLLDAQIAALSSELSAANAVYDFMDDYLHLQRSVGRFDITLTEQQKDQELLRLKSLLLHE